MVEISPDAWIFFFFFFRFLGNDYLSESQLFAAMGGGGRIFPGGVLGGVGGKQASPGEAEHCAGQHGCGLRLLIFREPWGQAGGPKVGWSPATGDSFLPGA